MANYEKGITIKFRAETTTLDKALGQIRRETKSLNSELKSIDRALKFNPGSVELWGQKQQVLTQKITETDEKLKVLKQAQKDMDARGVDHASAEYRDLQREIIETESRLKNFKAQLREIGNVKLKALGEQFKAFGKKATDTGKALTTKVTAPLAAIGAVAAKKFADVDKTMTLTNSTMGNTEEEAQLLSKAMKEAAANSTYGMNDAAQASLNFARAGLDAEQAASALSPAMALAAGEGGNLDTVSGGLVATINGFHGSFDQAAQYADVFANACNNSALDVDSLSGAMSVAAPIFASAGYSVNDAALYMGVMANNGIEANKAANSLKTGLARLISPSKEGAEMMDKLGLSVTNSDGTMKSSVQIQKELHDAFSQLSESEQIAAASAIFGKNQMAPWLALINTSTADVSALNEAIGQNGTAMKMQADMMGGYAGSIEKLKSGIDVMLTSLGEALAPVITAVANGIQKLVDWFNGLSPSAQRVIAVVMLIVAAIGPLLIIIGTLASSIGSIISLVGMAGPLIAAAAGPIALIVGIVAMLIVVGIALYKNWDKIKAKAQELWGKIKTVFTAIGNFFTTIFNFYKTLFTTFWGAIFAVVKAYVNLIKTIIVTVFTAIKTVVTAIWKGIKTAILLVWALIVASIRLRVNLIKTIITTVFGAIRAVVTRIWTGIKNAIVRPIEAAVGIVRGAIEKIKSIVNNAHLSLPKFKLPHFRVTGGKLPWGIGGKGVAPTINVDWYAQGGIFDKASVIGVGEAGSEAVVPLDQFWKRLDKLAERLQGGVVNIYINGADKDPKQIAEEVKRILIKETNQRRLAWQ